MSINPITTASGNSIPSPIAGENGAKTPAERPPVIEHSGISEPRRNERAKDSFTEERVKPQKAGLELRVGILPNTDVILIRFVEPNSGEVVREFPPEKLAEALAEIRARAAAHFDKTA